MLSRKNLEERKGLFFSSIVKEQLSIVCQISHHLPVAGKRESSFFFLFLLFVDALARWYIPHHHTMAIKMPKKALSHRFNNSIHASVVLPLHAPLHSLGKRKENQGKICLYMLYSTLLIPSSLIHVSDAGGIRKAIHQHDQALFSVSRLRLRRRLGGCFGHRRSRTENAGLQQ